MHLICISYDAQLFLAFHLKSSPNADRLRDVYFWMMCRTLRSHPSSAADIANEADCLEHNG